MTLANLTALADKATPGPWAWFGNRSLPIYLATPKGGRRFVMTFEATTRSDGEYEQTSAQPLFQVYSDREGGPWEWNGKMTPASELAVCPKTYRDDITGIDHPDAALIAAAPDMAQELQGLAQDMRVIAETTPHVQGCQQPDDPHCAACIAESALARLADFDGRIG